MDIGIAFISFDFKKGTVVLYSNNITEDFCSLLALKTVVTGFSNNRQDSIKSYYAESIIPFPNENKVVFSYLFPIFSNQNKEPRSCALSLVIQESDQNILYATAHVISKMFREFSKKIQDNYVYPQTLNENLADSLEKFTQPDYLISLTA